MEPCAYFSNRPGKGGTVAVQLVDKQDLWDVVMPGLGPNFLGLGLNAGYAVKNADGAIKNAQRTQDLKCKVGMSGGVDKIYVVCLSGTKYRFSAGRLTMRCSGGRRPGEGDGS